MIPWLIRPKDGIEILAKGNEVLIHDPGLATTWSFTFSGKPTIELLYKTLTHRRTRKLFINALKAALEEGKNGRTNNTTRI